MDTSEQYIKMCEKAEEIQKEWKPSVGDYIRRKYTIFGEEIDRTIWPDPEQSEEITILHYKSQINGYFYACKKDGEERIFNTQEETEKVTSIWLPRQDQLQEMVDNKPAYHTSYGKFVGIVHFLDTNPKVYCGSPEQIWIQFVMKEKFGKVWDGKEWVKEGW